ncbi:Peptidase family M23 [Flavobacteriaceae bacterium MAR_2010_188]|nr:Peptidase family M23 [Flavobacteriaceae bacterium MAR_2010_188]
MASENKDKKFTKKLLHKYRLVILNEDTFEERFAIKLTRLNVFVILSLGSILLVAGTIVLIAFTSLKEYIPGYASSSLRKQATELDFKTDSLQKVIDDNDQYYASIKRVLSGDVQTAKLNKDSILNAAKNDVSELNLKPTKEDSVLRELVDKEDKYNLFDSATSSSTFVLFPPVNGSISDAYNVKENHYAVDVVVKEETPVKSTADGTVIFAEWTADTGYVIIIEHSYELISVYKHNSSLTKEQGELVKAGEVIAMTGNTGELTSGPHLHFELWKAGYPVDPTNFIDFN